MKGTKKLYLNAGSVQLNERGQITVHGFTKGGQWYQIEMKVDDLDVQNLIEASIKYAEHIEQEAVVRLERLRKAHRYNATTTEITYKQSN